MIKIVNSRVAAIVLAAGEGRRFDVGDHKSKLLASYGGVPLVRRAVATAGGSRAAFVTVVTGHAHDEVVAALDGLTVEFVRNTRFAAGMAGSLRAGLATLPGAVDGVLIVLADMPCVEVSTLNRLIARFEDRLASPQAVVPLYEGRRGNPVLIGRQLFSAIGALTGDQGARSLLVGPDLDIEFCQVADAGVVFDIDTMAELEYFDRRTPR